MTNRSASSTGGLRRRGASIVSPLRYPGGKRRLVGYVMEALKMNGLRPEVFVEPFAGGANISLEVLNEGLVDRVVLGEKDPLVAGFWRTVFHDHEWLIDRIASFDFTLREWDRFRLYRPRTDRGRALKCIYLNRTSFSGILNKTAGPIGGRKQASEYKMDCRFPVGTLAKRIKQAASLADRVELIHTGDWAETVRKAQSLTRGEAGLFLYLDPPFYHKADRLYRFCFQEADHLRLRDFLIDARSPYLLSYDAASRIIQLYESGGLAFRHVEMLYSATKRGDLIKATELIVTNLRELPEGNRLWKSSGEWTHDPAPTASSQVQQLDAVA
jgi:DNA adenine methylase